MNQLVSAPKFWTRAGLRKILFAQPGRIQQFFSIPRFRRVSTLYYCYLLYSDAQVRRLEFSRLALDSDAVAALLAGLQIANTSELDLQVQLNRYCVPVVFPHVVSIMMGALLMLQGVSLAEQPATPLLVSALLRLTVADLTFTKLTKLQVRLRVGMPD